MFGRGLGFAELDRTALGGLQQGAAGDVAQRTLARGMRHIVITGGGRGRFGAVIMGFTAFGVAAASGGGMFGHRGTVLRAEG